MADCEHDLAEKQAACIVDGLCPLCFRAEIKRLKDFIELEIEHAEAFSDIKVDSKASMRAFIIRAEQALKEVK